MTEIYWELQFLNRRSPENGWQPAIEFITSRDKAQKHHREMTAFYDNEDFELEYRVAKVIKTVETE